MRNNTQQKQHTPELQPRDKAVMRDLIDSRVMKLSQISALHFDGKAPYAQKRVLKLKRAGYINERVPENRGRVYPSLLSLSRRGFAAFANDNELGSIDARWSDLEGRLAKISESTLDHEIDVVDMKIALVNAVKAIPSLQLDEFSTYPKRFEFLTEHIGLERAHVLKPDGYAQITLADGRAETLYMEWDKSTEAHKTLGIKAFGYKAWRDSGAFSLWNGGTVEDRDQYSFRALFVLPNDERRNNTAEHLLRLAHPKTGARLRNEIWLTTHAEFLARPLGPIFVTLGAYKRATAGTPFDPGDHKAMMRVLARDRLVAERLVKIQLLGGVS